MSELDLNFQKELNGLLKKRLGLKETSRIQKVKIESDKDGSTIINLEIKLF